MGFTWRYTPEFICMKTLLDRGYVGTIREVHAHWLIPFPSVMAIGWMTQLEQGGGILANMGSHEIDRVRRLLGREAVRLCGETKRIVKQGVIVPERRYFRESMSWRPEMSEKPLEAYETAQVTADTGYYFIADFEGDVTTVFRAGPAKDKTTRGIEVFGDARTLIFDDHGLRSCPYNGKEFTPVDIPADLTHRPEGVPEGLNYLWGQLLKAFVESVNGENTDVPTFYDGVKGQEIMDAVRLSGQENRWVRLIPIVLSHHL
jgi:predicted dehydrogenase